MLHDRLQVKGGAGHGGHVVQRRELSRSGSDSFLQQLLRLYLLGDVANDAQDVGFAPVDKGRAVHLDVEGRPILVQIDCPAWNALTCPNRLQTLLKERVIIRMDELREMLADEFFSRIAVHLAERGVDLNDGAVQIADHQAVEGRLKDAAILGLSFGQAGLGLLALGDVLDL